MLYAKVDLATKNIIEYPIDVKVLRQRFKDMNISLPIDIEAADLRSFGYYGVPSDNKQPIPPEGYRAVLGMPEWKGDNLERTWVIVPIDVDFEIRLWHVIRKRRNTLLRESDWTELPSVRLVRSADWCEKWDTYRQQLRDITKTRFPNMVIFPEKPNETK